MKLEDSTKTIQFQCQVMAAITTGWTVGYNVHLDSPQHRVSIALWKMKHQTMTLYL